MNDNTGRVLTLKVVITDPNKAEWIWKNRIGRGDPANVGVSILGIAEGDLFEEVDRYAKAAAFFIRELDETTEEAIEAHCDGGFDNPEEGRNKANDNVSKGSSWEIVDRHGNVYYRGKNEE